MIERLCIIGVGLIGGSLARALRQAGACREIVGAGRDPAHLEQAVKLGVIDRYALDAGAAVEGADGVVIAVPLGAVEGVLRRVRGRLGANAVVTDVGSAKGSVVDAARAVFGAVPPWFVPGHPLAGTEKNGVAASVADLFRGRRVILTPLPETDRAALARVRALWECAGAEVVEMDVTRHDQVLAATSHVPHLLAYALVDGLARRDGGEEIFRFAAGGFRDFTRIASSDPVMWRDICLANRAAVLAELQRFGEDLGRLAEAIRQGDGERITAVFNRAKQARDRFIESQGQDMGPTSPIE
ncbi:MAG: prephenate dehydrogenase/arogenate dehydrogenase family protein [Gammaproteobacteria bacterium]|nr:prephenate dehydrogenase/arogenate dehydrogenase family protein [Gammaproteobacteria bacterium]